MIRSGEHAIWEARLQQLRRDAIPVNAMMRQLRAISDEMRRQFQGIGISVEAALQSLRRAAGHGR